MMILVMSEENPVLRATLMPRVRKVWRVRSAEGVGRTSGLVA